MRQTVSKKLRKLYRRDLRKQIEMFSEILRPKPWWIPKRIWFLLMRIVIKNLGHD